VPKSRSRNQLRRVWLVLCRYTARYIDRVMQGALADGAGRLGPTVAAALKAMEAPEPTGKGTKSGMAGPDPQTGRPELISTKY